MACPHVAGAAALVWGAHPGATPKTIKQALLNTVDKFGAYKTACRTSGRLNLNRALRQGIGPTPGVSGKITRKGSAEPITGAKVSARLPKTQSFSKSAKVKKKIPDDTPKGVDSVIKTSRKQTVTRVIVGVDITHRWNEDITIKLTAPSGQSTRLKEVKASGLVEGLDIERTFVTTALNGQSSKGKWTLKVADAFDGGDGKDGVFNSWTLEVKFHKGFDVFATANTDKKGNYLLDNLPGKRTYNISPSKSGFQFQPKSRDIAVEKKPVKNIKFTGKRKKGKPQKRGPQSKPEGQRS
jgi:subtilisin-like proprotein convertase family protein